MSKLQILAMAKVWARSPFLGLLARAQGLWLRIDFGLDRKRSRSYVCMSSMKLAQLEKWRAEHAA
ncbi:hypothetical protein [Variovorax sp. SRS16]|uniref:hypothetical protein n=1 Tax=Variovorax sp. SRS16 TaxID=282217 RepID=UPI0013A59729|nr:hypothetical protein [Variovorax sp. SRS16]